MKLESDMPDVLLLVPDLDDDERPAALLLNTAPMMVIARVPPKGTAKDMRAITEAMLLGKKPIPCRVPGMKRIPVPAPERAIMP